MNWCCQNCGYVVHSPHGVKKKCHRCDALDWKKTEAVPHAHTSEIEHPIHYGGADNPYEAIKVIEAWQLGFNLGNCLKYISRVGKKGDALTDLRKARWYLDRHIAQLESAK